MLPDGRIGGLINSPTTNVYVWFVQEDGVWKIDEYHPIVAGSIDPNAHSNPPARALHATRRAPHSADARSPSPDFGRGLG